MPQYQYIVVQTYRQVGESSRAEIRARPVPGQGVSTDLQVECSKDMREAHPVGTKFRVRARLKQKLGGKPFLYTSWQWPYEVVTADRPRAV